MIICGGKFRIDGGSMFGVVPKTLWEKLCPADEKNRISMVDNCLLLEIYGKLVLVDTGNGTKYSQKEKDIYCMEDGTDILSSLELERIRPESIDIVVLTHLHFDHAGGNTVRDGENVRPAFPNARYYVQRREWEDAVSNRSTMTASYRSENFVPLQEAGQLHLLDGDAEIVPGLKVVATGGHVDGHQAVFAESPGGRFIFPGDLIPMSHHVRTAYNSAFDMHPYDTLARKLSILEKAAREIRTVVFEHDPVLRQAAIAEGENGRFSVRE